MGNNIHTKMDISNRAKQFMPFAALKGLPEALAAKEHIVVPKPTLSEDRMAELDQKLSLLKPGNMSTIIYYHQDEYLKITGIIARIDNDSRLLQIVNTKISFSDILGIELSVY